MEIFQMARFFNVPNQRYDSLEDCLEDLIEKAVQDDDRMFWKLDYNSVEKNDLSSINIHIASYALMAFVQANREVNSIKVKNWLLEQKIFDGDKASLNSAVDTALALDALTTFNKKFYVPKSRLKISFRNGNTNFEMNFENSHMSQTRELPENTEKLNIYPEGNGTALLRIVDSYEKKLENPVRVFDLKVEIQPEKNRNLLHLKIGASFIPQDDKKVSELAILEVRLPDGYAFDSKIPGVEIVGRVRVRFYLRHSYASRI